MIIKFYKFVSDSSLNFHEMSETDNNKDLKKDIEEGARKIKAKAKFSFQVIATKNHCLLLTEKR